MEARPVCVEGIPGKDLEAAVDGGYPTANAEQLPGPAEFGIASVTASEHVMTAEQCLRAFIIKDMNGYDYGTLALKLADSRGHESFCKTDALGEGPRRRETLEAYLERISVETVERLHAALVRRRE